MIPHRHHWRPSHRCTPSAASDGHSAHSIPTFPLPLPHPLPYRLPTAPHRRRRPIAPAPPDGATSPAPTPPRRPSHPSPVRNRLTRKPHRAVSPRPAVPPVRSPHPPPMPHRQTHADRSLATVPVFPSSPPHFPELGRSSTQLGTPPRSLVCGRVPLLVPLPAVVTTRILS